MKMSVRTAAATALAGAALAAVGLAAGPAYASAAHPDSLNCTYGHNGNIMTASCGNTTQSGWYLRLTCQRLGNNRIYTANGSLVYGSGTSQATCGMNDVIGERVVELT
jgi:hypothetical protein